MAPRVALLCQFKDPEEYLACFHAHHARLFDRIFYLDHCSQKDHRFLDFQDTEFFRTNISNFVKDIFITRMIQEIRVNYEFDFLFVLDIDEFLPFQDRSEFHNFLQGYSKVPVGTLFWKNGYPENFVALSESPRLIVQKVPANTKKLFYNLKRIGHFFPKEGNHNADYPFLGQTRFQVRPRRDRSGAAIFHIPFVSSRQIQQKLKDYPAEDFEDKIDFTPEVDTFLLSQETCMNVIGNYRSNSVRFFSKDDFESISLFEAIQGPIQVIEKSLYFLRQKKQELERLTAEQVSDLRSRGFGRRRKLLRQLYVDDDHILRLGVR